MVSFPVCASVNYLLNAIGCSTYFMMDLFYILTCGDAHFSGKLTA